MPIEVEAHTVPQFKAPVNGKAEGLWQDHAGTFDHEVKWHCEFGRFST